MTKTSKISGVDWRIMLKWILKYWRMMM